MNNGAKAVESGSLDGEWGEHNDDGCSAMSKIFGVQDGFYICDKFTWEFRYMQYLSWPAESTALSIKLFEPTCLKVQHISTIIVWFMIPS